jgi:hypothetical protein
MASVVSATNVSVPTTAGGTLLLAASAHRSNVVIRNYGASTGYIGAQGLTSSTGFPLDAGESVTIQESGGSLYAIAGAGTLDFRVLVG